MVEYKACAVHDAARHSDLNSTCVCVCVCAYVGESVCACVCVFVFAWLVPSTMLRVIQVLIVRVYFPRLLRSTHKEDPPGGRGPWGGEFPTIKMYFPLLST